MSHNNVAEKQSFTKVRGEVVTCRSIFFPEMISRPTNRSGTVIFHDVLARNAFNSARCCSTDIRYSSSLSLSFIAIYLTNHELNRDFHSIAATSLKTSRTQ